MSNTEIATRTTLDAVQDRIGELVQAQRLALPPNYSAGNALQAAWLQLQDLKNKDKKPVLEVCTRASITQSLFAMVVQGLDPARQQGYFIPYGRTLTFQRSYFGTLALAKRAGGVVDAVARMVYAGDDFAYEIRDGEIVVTKHVQTLDSIEEGTIRAAYAVATLRDGRQHVELMTMSQVQASWEQSRMAPDKADSTHSRFPTEMVGRTVLARALKRYVNTGDDRHLTIPDPDDTIRMDQDAAANAGDRLSIPDADDPSEPDEHEHVGAWPDDPFVTDAVGEPQAEQVDVQQEPQRARPF